MNVFARQTKTKINAIKALEPVMGLTLGLRALDLLNQYSLNTLHLST